MDTKDIIVFAVIDESHIPIAVTTDASLAEEILAEWISKNAYELEGEEFYFEENTDAMVWEEPLEDLLDSNPDLLTPEQIKDLIAGETILL